VAVILGIGCTWCLFAYGAVPLLARAVSGADSLQPESMIRRSVEAELSLWFDDAGTLTLIPILLALALLFRLSLLERVARFFRAVASELPGKGYRGALGFAGFVGLLGGLAEALARILGERLHPIPTRDVFSPDVVWLAPLAAVAGLGVIALVISMLDRALRARSAVLGAVPFLSVATATFSFCRETLAQAHPAACAVLAVGAGSVVSRAIRDHGGLRAVIRRSVPVLAVVPCLFCTTFWLLRHAQWAAAPTDAQVAQGQPNVLLVVWDAVRAADVSLYGYERKTTPELDRFAKGGVAFDDAWATAPWSLPGHASLFTGRWNRELSVDYEVPLDDRWPTLAEVLARDGYRTAAFFGNPVYGRRSFGLSRGFATYDDRPRIGLEAAVDAWWLSSAVVTRWRHLSANRQWLARRSAADINRTVLDWLSRERGRPFFVFMNYIDAHEPYLPPPPFQTLFSPVRPFYWFGPINQDYDRRQLSELHTAYDDAIGYLDSRFGMLIRELEGRGLLDSTLVIVTADHGEEFGGHGRRIVGHGRTLFAPSLRVPLVIRLPGQAVAGVRVREPVSLRDIPATIAQILDLGGHPFPGRSLIPPPDETAESPPIFASQKRMQTYGAVRGVPTSQGEIRSVVVGPYHFIRGPEEIEQLFDLRTDPMERLDLSNTPRGSAVVARLRDVLLHPPPDHFPM
jgi:arylsulfatase A-like enzyme